MFHIIVVLLQRNNLIKNKKNESICIPRTGLTVRRYGQSLYDNEQLAKELFDKADEILGFKITDIMFAGTDEQLKQTNVTQPAVFLHSVISALCLGSEFKPDMVAGHSLGEFSALVAAGALSFEDGLKLVALRANSMQKACEQKSRNNGSHYRRSRRKKWLKFAKQVTNGGKMVVAANFNCPGQLVISGSKEGIDESLCLAKRGWC